MMINPSDCGTLAAKNIQKTSLQNGKNAKVRSMPQIDDRMSLEDARSLMASVSYVGTRLRRQRIFSGIHPEEPGAISRLANDLRYPELQSHVSNIQRIIKSYTAIFSRDVAWRQEVHDIVENHSQKNIKRRIFLHYRLSQLRWSKSAKIRHAETLIKYSLAMEYAKQGRNIPLPVASSVQKQPAPVAGQSEPTYKNNPDANKYLILILKKGAARKWLKKFWLFGIGLGVYTLYRYQWNFSQAEFWLLVELLAFAVVSMFVWGDTNTLTESEYYRIEGSTDAHGEHRCAWCGGRGIWRKSEYKSNDMYCHCSKCRRLLWTESK